MTLKDAAFFVICFLVQMVFFLALDAVGVLEVSNSTTAIAAGMAALSTILRAIRGS